MWFENFIANELLSNNVDVTNSVNYKLVSYQFLDLDPPNSFPASLYDEPIFKVLINIESNIEGDPYYHIVIDYGEVKRSENIKAHDKACDTIYLFYMTSLITSFRGSADMTNKALELVDGLNMKLDKHNETAKPRIFGGNASFKLLRNKNEFMVMYYADMHVAANILNDYQLCVLRGANKNNEYIELNRELSNTMLFYYFKPMIFLAYKLREIL